MSSPTSFRAAVVSLLAVLVAAGAGLAAGPDTVRVVRHPDPSAPLAERWAWGLRQAAGADLGGGCRIVYSIRRRMPSDHFYGHWDSRNVERRTLGQILSGAPVPVMDAAAREKAVREAARKALDRLEGRREPVKIVDRDMALLFRFGSAAGRPAAAIDIYSFESLLDEGLPIIWLGPAAEADSEAFLERLFAGPGSETLKRDIVEAVGIHPTAPGAIPFLLRVALPGSPEPVRREAADALGERDDVRAVAALKAMAASDPSPKVREDAVDALAESSSPASIDALAGLAASATNDDLRQSAVEGLAEKAAEASAPDLSEADESRDAQVRREAVEALAEWPVKEALPRLIDLAKTSPDPVVRRAALEALGEMSGEPAAVAALVAVCKKAR